MTIQKSRNALTVRLQQSAFLREHCSDQKTALPPTTSCITSSVFSGAEILQEDTRYCSDQCSCRNTAHQKPYQDPRLGGHAFPPARGRRQVCPCRLTSFVLLTTAHLESKLLYVASDRNQAAQTHSVTHPLKQRLSAPQILTLNIEIP